MCIPSCGGAGVALIPRPQGTCPGSPIGKADGAPSKRGLSGDPSPAFKRGLASCRPSAYFNYPVKGFNHVGSSKLENGLIVIYHLGGLR